MSLVKMGLSPTVCEPCKKRKKSCNKALPSCSRCSRLFVKCSYSSENTVVGNRPPVLPPLHILSNSIPGLGAPAHLPSLSGVWEHPYGKSGQSLTTDDQVSLQSQKLLNAISRKSGDMVDFCEIYFRKFHHALPILNKEVFYRQLQNLPSDSHFSALLLCIYLIAHMVTHSSATDDRRYDLYPTLKSIHSLLQSTGRVSHELIQAGILISSFEYCQGLFQEAWMSVGTCVRMAQILGLQESIRKPLPKERDSRTMLETERCVWWAIVIVERNIISAWKKSKLPCASSPPQLDDYLPLTASGEDRLHEDLVLPKDLDLSWSNASLSRDFTRFGSFAATVQSTYLAGLVVQHVQDENRDAATRQDDAARLEGALQSYLCALIPPAGEAKGSYCGAFGLRTCMAFYFHQHEFDLATKRGDTIGASRAKLAIQSMVRTNISMTQVSYTGSPIDFDTLAYWSHRLIPDTAMMHIKFGERNSEWQAGLDLMKFYLRGIESRYKLYANYLREIEAAEEATRSI